jgi:hypothetical protein
LLPAGAGVRPRSACSRYRASGDGEPTRRRRFIAVDPVDENARDFYRHFGFKDVPGDERGRMFVRIDQRVHHQ